MSQFKKDDTVRCIKSTSYTTKGKVYHVYKTGSDANSTHIIDDDGDRNYYTSAHFELVGTAPLANPHERKTVATPRIIGHSARVLVCDDIADSEDEPSYDERKASARVTSQGVFSAGDRLVYTDGTPIPIDGGVFIVKTCTDSAVWFEHCWSVPFNPSEFRVER